MGVVRQLGPDIVILELGTNDLASEQLELIGSALEELVHSLKSEYGVKVVCVCHVIPRGLSYRPHPLLFWEKAKILRQYLDVVLITSFFTVLIFELKHATGLVSQKHSCVNQVFLLLKNT